jgi:hypothetical protein
MYKVEKSGDISASYVKCDLGNKDGSLFNEPVARGMKALIKSGYRKEAIEMLDKIKVATTWDGVLSIIAEYIEDTHKEVIKE